MANTNTTITAGQVAPAVVNLGSGSSIPVDASAGNDFRVTLGAGATAIASPINSVDGQRITFQLTQPSGGAGTVSWGADYDWGGKTTANAAGSSAPALSAGGGFVDIVGFVYNALHGKWCYVGAALGF
ncbi:MAG TPA: hypothetical protein VH478_03980 [Trebonia sp.]|jgi:hypothetical protein|nr:hypothetical protein [Trebonia sp.]